MSHVLEKDLTWLAEAQPGPCASQDYWSAQLVAPAFKEDARETLTPKNRISFGWVLAINALLWLAAIETFYFFF